MKKILLIATVVASLSGLTAFAQGNFSFGSPASYVWNSTAGTRGGAFNVGFAWNSSGSGAPLVGSSTGVLGTRTNAVENFGPSNPWESILNDPNYTVGALSGSSATVVGTLSATGGIVYNAGSPFLVKDSSPNGGTVQVYMFAWDNTYATPALAGAAGAAVGWSKPFAYTYANGSSAPAATIGQVAAGLDSNAYKFGVAPVPEPTTFALAGLGMAAMLIARRRK